MKFPHALVNCITNLSLINREDIAKVYNVGYAVASENNKITRACLQLAYAVIIRIKN